MMTDQLACARPASLPRRAERGRLNAVTSQNRRMLVLAASFLDGAAAVFGFPMVEAPPVIRRDPRADAARLALDMGKVGGDMRRALDEEAQRRGA